MYLRCVRWSHSAFPHGRQQWTWTFLTCNTSTVRAWCPIKIQIRNARTLLYCCCSDCCCCCCFLIVVAACLLSNPVLTRFVGLMLDTREPRNDVSVASKWWLYKCRNNDPKLKRNYGNVKNKHNTHTRQRSACANGHACIVTSTRHTCIRVHRIAMLAIERDRRTKRTHVRRG